MGLPSTQINTVFNLASGAVPGVNGQLGCSAQQGDPHLLQPLPTTAAKNNVLNFGGWGNPGGAPVLWTGGGIDQLTTNIDKIAEYCKKNQYNYLSYDIEGVSGDIGPNIAGLCLATKSAGLGTILTLPGFGVSSKFGTNDWFKEVPQDSVDFLCLMYYNQDSDTEKASNPVDGSKAGYTS